MKIALVKCAVLPEPDMDEAPTLAAFRAAGHEAHTLAWDDPKQSPAGFDVCLIRATWDYVEKLDAFLAWCEQAASVSRVVNSASVIRWNAHKAYLAELESAGVPIVPTRFVRSDGSVDAAAVLASAEWEDVVVKPSVGAGSYLTKRFRAHQTESAAAFLAEQAASRDMMIQQYLPSVESTDGTGERSLVWIAGEVTHAVEKMPRFDGDDESVRGRSPTEQERDFAHKTVDAAVGVLGETPMYARVDVMTLDSGETVLSELELIEPSLFFPLGNGAVERFVRATEASSAGV